MNNPRDNQTKAHTQRDVIDEPGAVIIPDIRDQYHGPILVAFYGPSAHNATGAHRSAKTTAPTHATERKTVPNCANEQAGENPDSVASVGTSFSTTPRVVHGSQHSVPSTHGSSPDRTNIPGSEVRISGSKRADWPNQSVSTTAQRTQGGGQ